MIVILRGHIRNSFDTPKLYDFIKKLVNEYDNIEIYIHTWNIFQNNISWRQLDINNNVVTEDTIYTYFKDINKNIKHIIIDDDKSIKLNGDLTGFLCNTRAPVIGWKNYWYGKFKIIKYIINNINSPKDINKHILNMRFDIIERDDLYFKMHNITRFLNFYKNKELNKNVFMYNEACPCIDNIYLGNTIMMFKLAYHFHHNLDHIKNTYPTEKHQECMVYNENTLLM